MSLANIKGKLSRAEMKNIMAGSATCAICYNPSNGIICGPPNWSYVGAGCISSPLGYRSCC